MGAYVWPVDNWQAADTSKYTGRRLRQLIGALVTGKSAARPLGARSGVIAGTPSSTVTATSTTCTVNPHAGVIDAQTLAIAGPYFYSIDAAVTKTVPAADASQTRVDVVAVQISDPAEADGTATPGVDVVYVSGTPGAGAPAVPARSLALATVNVPKLNSGSPSVTWLPTYTVAAGGVLPVSPGQYPVSPYVGQYVDDSTNGLLRWDGAAWTPPSGAVKRGATNCGTLAASGLLTITHGLGVTPSNVILSTERPTAFPVHAQLFSKSTNTMVVQMIRMDTGAPMTGDASSTFVHWQVRP